MRTSADLVAVGLSHWTAPIEVRERLAMDADGLRRQLEDLQQQGVIDEALLVSTCNRVELYAIAEPGQERIRNWLDSFRGPAGEPIAPYLYWHHGRDAVLHLFRVAASLDSLIVGEPQILGQVKDAIRVAESSGSMGRVLTRLSHRSLSVAKRVRSETDLGRARVGVGNAGVDLALQIFGTLEGQRALLVGTGEMGRQVARALLNSGLEELIVTSRTYENAVRAAQDFGGTPIRSDRMDEYLSRVDVIVTATGATTPIIGPAQIRAALRERRYRPLFLIDLSVPRNIDPAVDQLEQAYLFNIDDLRQVVQAGKEARSTASVNAIAMVEQEADRFLKAMHEVDVGPRIGAITHRMEAVRVAEIERSHKLMGTLDSEQRQALDAFSKALVKKVLHAPIQGIRGAARDQDGRALEALLNVWEKHSDE